MRNTITMVPVFTCEHASNHIPKSFHHQINQSILQTHNAYDLGASDMSMLFSQYFNQPVITGDISRLIVDLNRSIYRNKCFSDYTQTLTPAKKEVLLSQYYHPFREKTQQLIQEILNKQNHFVLHLSIHSFTPVLNNEIRKNDIGILYDPKRKNEKIFSHTLSNQIKNHSENSLSVRMNYPYLGTADGHTTALRKILTEKYIGIELEVNQKLIDGNTQNFPHQLNKTLINSLEFTLRKLETELDHAH